MTEEKQKRKEFEEFERRWEFYTRVVPRLSKRVCNGYVLSSNERKELRRFGSGAQRAVREIGDILVQSDINSLPPPSKSRLPRTLYLLRFESRDDVEYARRVALAHGPVRLPSHLLTIGLTSEEQYEHIEKTDIKYTLLNQK